MSPKHVRLPINPIIYVLVDVPVCVCVCLYVSVSLSLLSYLFSPLSSLTLSLLSLSSLLASLSLLSLFSLDPSSLSLSTPSLFSPLSTLSLLSLFSLSSLFYFSPLFAPLSYLLSLLSSLFSFLFSSLSPLSLLLPPHLSLSALSLPLCSLWFISLRSFHNFELTRFALLRY
jgi:hypothetical protein